MTIVEYEIVDGRTPDWIIDGGQWGNLDDNIKLIGTGVEGSIPDGTQTYTLEELQTRQLAIHAKEPMRVGEGGRIPVSERYDMSDDEVKVKVKAWWDARVAGIPYGN